MLAPTRAAGLALALGLGLALVGGPASVAAAAPLLPATRAMQTMHTPMRHLQAAPPDSRLLGFYRALEAVEAGRRRDPVVVLQIGDSHTANDSFSGRLRELFQQRFGTGGRGVLPAGIPYAYFRPAGVQVSASGWERIGGRPVAAGSDSPPPGMIGLTAARMHSAGAAEMTYRVDDPADLQRVAIEVLQQPGGGTLQVAYDDQPAWLLNTAPQRSIDRPAPGRSPMARPWALPGLRPAVLPSAGLSATASGAMWIDLPPTAGAHTMTLRTGTSRTGMLRTGGKGPVDVLAVELRRAPPGAIGGVARAGVIWVNLGTIGAQVWQVASWDPAVVAADLRHLRPDLIVLAFGTNEGFSIAINPQAYQAAYLQAGRRLTQSGATLAVIEPPDGNRRMPPPQPAATAGDAATGLPTAGAGTPAAANPDAGSPVSCAPAFDESGQPAGTWIEPPALALVRGAQEAAARAASWFTWDWAAAMGGACSMARWAVATPPLGYADHVHLRPAGARQTAEALFSALMTGYARFRAARHGP